MVSVTTDGDIMTLDAEAANPGYAVRDVTDFSSTTYPKLAIRIKSVAGGTWGIDLYYDAAWNNLCTGQTGTGLVEFSLPSGKTIEQIRIRAETANCVVEVDYISCNKTAVEVPLDAPTTQDIVGDVIVRRRLNMCSTASFTLNNIPSTFKTAGPYSTAVAEKDIVIIWMYRAGDTMSETDKVFGGIIQNLGWKGQKSAYHVMPVECIDHGWELHKPPTLFNNRYYSSGGTNGKTIMVAAVDLCSYLDSTLLDDGSDIATVFGDSDEDESIDYSEEGREVTPYTILEEFAPKCETSGGAVGFDWRVTPAGIVDMFPRATISSGVTLDDAELEVYDREKDWWRCWNIILVYGRAEKTNPAGPSPDSWTEGTAEASSTNATTTDTTSDTYELLYTTTLTVPAGKRYFITRLDLDWKCPGGSAGRWKMTYDRGDGEVEIFTEKVLAFLGDVWNTKTADDGTAGDDEAPDLRNSVRSKMGTNITLYFYGRTLGAGNQVDFRNAIIYYETIDEDWDVVADDLFYLSTTKQVGSHAVCVQFGNTNSSYIQFTPSTNLDMNVYPRLVFYIRIEDVANVEDYIQIVIYDGNAYTATQNFTIHARGEFIQIEALVGPRNRDRWVLSNVAFDWSDIEKIYFYGLASAAATWKMFLDGVHQAGRRYQGTANNSTSQTTWGDLRRPPEIDETLGSDDECVQKATGLLAVHEDSIITYPNIHFEEGSMDVDVGETVAVDITTPAADETVRCMEAVHALRGTEWETDIILSNEPVMIDHVFLEQQRKLKLALRGVPAAVR